MTAIVFAEAITPKEIRSLSAILGGVDTIPRRKDKKAEMSRFASLAGDNLSKFKKAASAGDMDALRKVAANVSNGEAETTDTPTNGEDTGTGRRGRKSQFVGKILRTTLTENPRRNGTHGHRSMEIIMKAGKEGIAHSAFIEAGGRNNDLGWDIGRERVEMTDE